MKGKFLAIVCHCLKAGHSAKYSYGQIQMVLVTKLNLFIRK